MQKRIVCKRWKEAAKKTIVPPTEFVVESVGECNGMRAMTTALPNLQQIYIGPIGIGHKYSDGEDPDEEQTARNASLTTHDIEIISNFSKLRILEIYLAPLNGRYPSLFNFSLLRKLSIQRCQYFKWDLDMLAGLPMLKEFECNDHLSGLTGNISSLRVLKDTLEMVIIRGWDIDSCQDVEGNFMDLADFPHLKELDLYGTAVIGDIRDIGENHFSSLEYLYLPKGVYGGSGYEFLRISDAPDVVRAVYLLKKSVLHWNISSFAMCSCRKILLIGTILWRKMSLIHPHFLFALLKQDLGLVIGGKLQG
jgi:hypothetical protein